MLTITFTNKQRIWQLVKKSLLTGPHPRPTTNGSFLSASDSLTMSHYHAAIGTDHIIGQLDRNKKVYLCHILSPWIGIPWMQCIKVLTELM
jgi:hypothetical protein